MRIRFESSLSCSSALAVISNQSGSTLAASNQRREAADGPCEVTWLQIMPGGPPIILGTPFIAASRDGWGFAPPANRLPTAPPKPNGRVVVVAEQF
jgi:hypothetical protein